MTVLCPDMHFHFFSLSCLFFEIVTVFVSLQLIISQHGDRTGHSGSLAWQRSDCGAAADCRGRATGVLMS